MDTVTPLNQKKDTKQLIIIAIVFLCVTAGIAWWGLQQIKNRTLIATENTLSTVLNTTKEALDIWVEDQITKTAYIANEPKIRKLVSALIARHKINESILESKELESLRIYLKNNRRHYYDFYLVLPDGQNIASLNDADINENNVIYRYRPALFKSVLSGIGRLIPPIPSDIPLPGKKNISGKSVPPTLFTAVPVENNKGDIIAIYAERFDPNESLTRITALGRIGSSGETYAFDREARLLTSSRFDHKMIQRGFMRANEDSILAFEIRDPGKKLTNNIDISLQHSEKPLTLMAKNAISGSAGANTQGYRDYRGELVFGSWIWLPHLNIGLTTEIDKEEALQLYSTTRSVIIFILFMLICLAIVFTYFVMLANKRVETNLKQAHDELEQKVKERTQELLNSETRLIEAKDLAEQASRSKSEFLACMSHEIRTPINGVMGMLGLLLNGTLSNEQERKITIAQNSATSLLSIINDILDFSKVEVGKIELENIDFNMEVLLDDVVKTMCFSAEENDLELILDTSLLSHKMVKGDPNRLRQIITNLIGNAIKFTSEGSIVLRCSSTQYKNSVLISCNVIDTGIGIPDEAIGNLFESFTQVDASTTREFGGTGLGLSICKKLVQLMQGDIEAKSELGKGSEFSFTATLDKSEKNLAPLPIVNLQSKNILVIDDNPINREIFTTLLNQWGAHVFEADSGANGLNVCKEFTNDLLDVIILDMQMPSMDGIQFTKILRRNPDYHHIKILMMTSVTHDQTPEELHALGLNGWLTKPVSTPDFHRSIITVLAQKSENPQFVTSAVLQAVKTKEDPEIQSSWPKETRILLVEDNDINQLVAEGLLDNIGLTCEVAVNGQECLSILNDSEHDNPFTVILMDCQMPVMDGYQATKNIREGKAGERYQGVPIIAMTANAMMGDRDKCISSGMNDYMSKPIETELLLKMLKHWLIVNP